MVCSSCRVSQRSESTRVVAGIELRGPATMRSVMSVSSGMMPDRTRSQGCGVGRCQRPEFVMLAQYPCFARRVKVGSENRNLSSWCSYCAWGCFSIFVSAQLVAGRRYDRFCVALTRIPFPGMITSCFALML
jgi:hypothetical protein